MENLKTRKELCMIFGFSMSTIERDLKVMRMDDYFKNFVHKMGSRLLKIELKGYEEYLRYKEQEYKKAL